MFFPLLMIQYPPCVNSKSSIVFIVVFGDESSAYDGFNLTSFLCLALYHGAIGLIVSDDTQNKYVRLESCYMCSGILLGVSMVSAPIIAHAMDAGDALVDDHELQDLSEEEENGQYLWRLARKFWLPIFFFVTVLTNLDNSITMLCIKLALFLLSTKPNPFSVYVFVDQLCQQSMRQEARFLQLKSLYASKVEVQDYKLLCMADVEVRDQKFTLVGILGRNKFDK
ncbi:unnamed protein product [Sphenostylis stenocarpa]|uniref:Uncharacterized protein n=1 Tax=Sphenostylis stenocarpa TaxID=92480 RepID=A0AA86SIK0_9FABA|nr:unnamed protein product [Sphenostylis stenocarpa]